MDAEEPNKEVTVPNNLQRNKPTSLVVTHLPKDATKREIEDFFGAVGPVRRCHLVRDKDWEFKGMAYVQFCHFQDAERAHSSLNRKQFRGSALKVKFSRTQKKEKKGDKKIRKKKVDAVNDEHFDGEMKEIHQKKRSKNRKKFEVNDEARNLKKGRLILRNLSFQVTEEIIRGHFSPYGTINEINIVRKDGKKLAGYAFLQYETKLQALKAIQECNMKPLLGRPVVVDLAVAKKKYESQTVKMEDSNDIKEEVVEIKQELGEENAESGGSSFNNGYPNVKIKEEKLDEDEDKDSGLEDKDNSEESDDESGSDDDDDDESSEDDESEEEEEGKGKPTKQPKTTNPSKDVAEERTVFIKNLSFDASQEDIANVLSEFGELKYVLLCMDPLTEHPRGTAFAQFKTKESASACLAATEDPLTKEKFVVLGRQMYIFKAVSRNTLIEKKNQENEKKFKDKRNLYLAREGFIRPGTQAAIGLSEGDLKFRHMREQVKRRMLKNLNIFISKTRLCINNLPEKFTDGDLRKLFLKHGEPGCKITEARIMRNLRDIGDDGKPKSRGYGFVSFTEHDHALAALRKLNNNPDIFTKNKRPIIEFSMENREIIQAREKRLAKSREKNAAFNKGKNMKNSELKGKKSQDVENSTGKEEWTNDVSYMGSKSDPSAGVKNALPTNIGPKVRENRASGKITRKQLRKQRLDRQKGRKRLRVFDNREEEPVAKKSKEDGTTTTKTKNKRKKKPLSKNLKSELRKEKSFNNMVNQYKQKMLAVKNETSSSKKWYED
ncbi:RNA-binding protein 28-like [Macrobrachium nipponense]|uniref:RNA-binding protein 28-like n=1 Tax=Macrobrachium nipponense TaxID=159736 RepID=UPI0030C80535